MAKKTDYTSPAPLVPHQAKSSPDMGPSFNFQSVRWGSWGRARRDQGVEPICLEVEAYDKGMENTENMILI